MAISVIGPISLSIDRTRRVLFAPFDIVKWLKLGFCAFLASLLEGGGSGNGGGGDHGHGGSRGGPELPESFSDTVAMAWQWLVENAFWAVVIAVVLVAVIVIVVVLAWLKARGKFMFLDGVVLNRGAIVEPWKRYRALGNSLFWFYLLFGVFSMVLFVGMAVGILAVIWPDIAAGEFGGRAIMGLALGACTMIPVVLIYGFIAVLLDDLVIPVMYLRGLGVWAAWGVFGREILSGHIGSVILFWLMRIAIGLAIAIATLLLCCFTCCLAALPYIGTVILLPLLTFDRCYGLYFLQQYGESWRFFADEAPAPPQPALAV
ncbi:MAG: hypothetical protein NT049_16025 [Planctomycetota bacterium]|nr:hypothetical protein [Planctomycetota bacterium]